MKKSYIIISIISIISVIGFVMTFIFNYTSLFATFGVFIILSNVLGILIISLIDWDGLDNLHKKTNDAITNYKENQLFLDALKTLLLKDKYPMEKIKEQMNKLK